MSINRIFSITVMAFSSIATHANSVQKIDVLNNCAQVMNLTAQNADHSFTINLKVPAYAKAFVISKITELNTLQDQLFMGIFRNSVEEVAQAIAAGANVNTLREGRTPLDWALSFGMTDAAVCLLQNGAR